MSVYRFDPTKHLRDRRGRFRKMLAGLQLGDELRLPNGVRISKGRDGREVHIFQNGRRQIVSGDSYNRAYRLAVSDPERRAYSDEISDQLADFKVGDREDLDGIDVEKVPGDADGDLYSVAGENLPMTRSEVADRVADARERASRPWQNLPRDPTERDRFIRTGRGTLPKEPQSPGTTSSPKVDFQGPMVSGFSPAMTKAFHMPHFSPKTRDRLFKAFGAANYIEGMTPTMAAAAMAGAPMMTPKYRPKRK